MTSELNCMYHVLHNELYHISLVSAVMVIWSEAGGSYFIQAVLIDVKK